MSLWVISGFAFYYDLFTAFFLQTWFFISFNKVMTAQYFMWFQAFLPVLLVNSDLPSKPSTAAAYCVTWTLIQSAWGYYANEFETLG